MEAPEAGTAHCRARSSARTRPTRVFMMDVLSTVPYYTGHLCAALEQTSDVRVWLGSTDYYLDPDSFHRQGLQNDPGLLDVVSKFRRIPAAPRRVLKMLEGLINLLALAVRFMLSRPDVIHVQFLPLANRGYSLERWFLAFARFLGVRLVYTVHNVLPHDTGERWRGLFQRIYLEMDRLICHDTGARERLVNEFGIPASRIAVIPHGPLFLDNTQRTREQARLRVGFRPEECVVLCHGILRPYKGVHVLVEAFRKLAARYPKARLVILGTGEKAILNSIQEQVRLCGIASSVRLVFRFVPVEELGDFCVAADILTYPYTGVTTSGSLMTGIGYARPIVASTLPVFEQILRHGVDALLVAPGDSDALAESLGKLIADPQLRGRLAKRLEQTARIGADWPDIARKTAECYLEVVSASDSADPVEVQCRLKL